MLFTMPCSCPRIYFHSYRQKNISVIYSANVQVWKYWNQIAWPVVSYYGSIDELIMKLTSYSHSGILSWWVSVERRRRFERRANMSACLLSQGANSRCGQKNNVHWSGMDFSWQVMWPKSRFDMQRFSYLWEKISVSTFKCRLESSEVAALQLTA